MGMFMRTAIVIKFRVAKSCVLKVNMDLEDAKNGLAKAIVKNPECFDCQEEDDYFVWRLKPDIQETRLLGFMTRYFNDFYLGQSDQYARRCQPVLDYLSGNPSADEFYDWLEEEGELTIDTREMRSVYFAQCKFNVRICNIELTSEGKVMYEELDQHLAFFEFAVREAYADDLLGGCLMVTVD